MSNVITQVAPGESNRPWSPGRMNHVLRIVALGLIVIGCFVILRPFLTAILWAMVLCVSTWPAYARMTRALRGRGTLAAFLMIAAIVLVLLAPFVVVGVSFADDVSRFMAGARYLMESPPLVAPQWLEGLPVVGPRIGEAWQTFAHDSVKLMAYLRKYVEPVTARLLSVSVSMFSGLVELALSIVLTFFLFRHGHAISRRLVGISENLAGGSARQLLSLSEKTVRGVVYGILGTALAQSILAGIGFLIVGLPGPGLLALVTFLLSVTPVGPPLVWIPATLWLFKTGAVGSAIFMAGWGLLVSCVDNVLKPLIIGQAGRMPFILVLMGVLGGALSFGFIGIFLGPTLLAVGLSLLQEWTKDQSLKSEPVTSPVVHIPDEPVATTETPAQSDTACAAEAKPTGATKTTQA